MTMSKKYDVFISYSRKDLAVVKEIQKLLDANTITYWVDTNKIEPGNEFMGTIVDAIENSTITLFISSADSNKSIYTAKEVALAFNSGKYIIPFKIDNSSFSKHLQFVMTDLNWVEAIPFSSPKAQKLVADIKALLYGERNIEVVNVPQREYIDVLQWNEPQNAILRFIKNIFREK